MGWVEPLCRCSEAVVVQVRCSRVGLSRADRSVACLVLCRLALREVAGANAEADTVAVAVAVAVADTVAVAVAFAVAVAEPAAAAVAEVVPIAEAEPVPVAAVAAAPVQAPAWTLRNFGNRPLRRRRSLQGRYADARAVVRRAEPSVVVS